VIAIVAKMKVKEGSEAEIEEVLRNLTAEVRAAEEGNLVYQLCKSSTDHSSYVMIELYSSPEDYAAHTSSSHLRAARAKLSAVLREPPIIDQYDAVV
jgi:quinol monooxygenase YgiN